MNVLIIGSLTLVALVAVVVVLTDDPARQAVTLSVFGLLLAILFMVLQAPDVALSEIAVGTVVVPLMIMLAVRKVRRRQ